MTSHPRMWAAAAACLALLVLTPRAARSQSAGYYTELDAAMARMHGDMHAPPTGDVDRDFARMMIPHHQGAVDMAVLLLQHGRDPRLRRLAQGIVVEQRQEIALMRAILAAPGAPAPVAAAAAAAAPPAPAAGGRDRVYAAEQFSNTVSVIDPSTRTLLGQIRLGDPQPANLSPLYRGQLLVHGLGFSPDHHTLVVVSIGSNSVSFIDTATNAVKHVTYVGRAPHEAFFTPDGKEVWVAVRGEDHIAVLDARTYRETRRIVVGNGPGMTIFSPDGKYGFVCSSFTPETAVVSVARHAVVARLAQDSPFCPNLAVSPDGAQLWLTLKDTGKVQVFAATPPFRRLATLSTGPLTNHVAVVHNAAGRFAYVTVGGLNEVQVYRADDFTRVATIPVGNLPHGVWPSADGARVYVGLEHDDAIVELDARTHTQVATIPVGQAPQAVVVVPDAASAGGGTQNLQPLAPAGGAVQLALAGADGRTATTVALFDQGITQVLQAAVTGLTPGKSYSLALAGDPRGDGALEPLARFTANPAGAAVVNAVGPIRQVVRADAAAARRLLVVAPVVDGKLGPPVQRQR